MKKVLVIFGSSSDKDIYEQIASNLKNSDVRVASAHREPELVEKILKEGHEIIIAGAGLAAHLPGVIASKTLRPVIGVPVNANFGGADSLLSIMQMPAGIPVLSVGINASAEAARNAALMLDQMEFITLLGNTNHERARKCTELLESFNINYEIADSPNETSININFTSLSNPEPHNKGLVINVPLAKEHSPEDIPKLTEITKKGLWVGLNRGDNAALAAIQILNLDGRYESRLEDYRKSLKQKIEKKELTYKDAGVDIDASDQSNTLIKELIKQTYNHNTLSELGSFGGLYRFNKNQYDNPILVSSTDGVGTKLKLAIQSGDHSTVGSDLVNHCVNDILVQGAAPLFFLDYIGCGKLRPKTTEDIVKGFTLACVSNGLVLIGGETAELPGLYKPSDYDLAGTIVGVVEKDKLITGEKIVPGDVVIGLVSNGLHTNGYSLAIKVLLDHAGYKLTDKIPGLGATLKDTLMKTHTSYLKPVQALLKKFSIKGMSHITGGGLPDNLKRILPKNCDIDIEKDSWEIPNIFKLIQEKGNVPEDDMYRTFNMGVGYVLIIPKNQVDDIMKRIQDFNIGAYKIGSVVAGTQNVNIKQSGFIKNLFKRERKEEGKESVREVIKEVHAPQEPQPLSESAIQDNIHNTLQETKLNLEERYQGKVRDTYKKDNKLVIITTDRVSAFDRVIGTIPFKGQILNQMAVFWFNKTKDICPNHLIELPDPNVSVVKVCKPFPVEVIVRQYLTGSLWRDYEKGNRNIYGLHFPEGLKKYHRFDSPILTPSTKATEGHDMPISRDEILQQSLLTIEQLEQTERIALELFRRGTEVAAKRGLVLVDTKYEFGVDENNNIILIDEIHTPDSSRYWYSESLGVIQNGGDPKEMNKEYIRQWLIQQGWMGDGPQPPLTDEVKVNAALRYAETFEKLTGHALMITKENVKDRIERNLQGAGYLS